MSANPFEPNALTVNADLHWETSFLGSILRTMRKKRGCSIGHLSVLSGVDSAEIHRVESGKQECRIQSLLRLCAALGTTPGYILDNSLICTVSRTEIEKRIHADSGFASVIKSLSFATPGQIAKLTDFLIESGVLFSSLLRSSNPVWLVNHYKETLGQLAENFIAFASRIAAIGEGLERASMIYGLLTSPMRELRSQGLLPDVLFTPAGLASLPSSQPSGPDVTSAREPNSQ